MLRRRTFPLLVVVTALLAAPSAASAAYDLTISTAATSGVTITNPTSRVTFVTATAPGATLNVTDLKTRLESSAASDGVQLKSGAGGTGAGDVTLAAPLSTTGTLYTRNDGAFRVDAALTVGTLFAMNVGGVVANTPAITASSTMSLQERVTLAQDLTLEANVLISARGATGAHALRVEAGIGQIEGDVGSAGAPVGSFVSPTGLALKGTVYATGAVTVGGELQLLGNSGLRSTGGDVTVGRVFDTQNAAAYDLTLTSGTVVRFGGATTEPPRTLTVTAPSILVSGSVAARSQTWTGKVTPDGEATFSAALDVRIDGGLTVGTGRTVRIDGGEGSALTGTLRGSATSTLEIVADPVFALASQIAAEPVAVKSIGTGTLEVGGVVAGPVTVASGTFRSGATVGPLTVESGATVAPSQGNWPTTLTAASLVLKPGATVRLGGYAGATPFDVVKVLGNATLGGATLNLVGMAKAFLDGNQTARLVDVGGALSGAFTGLADGDVVSVGGAQTTFRLDARGATLTRPPLNATVTVGSTKTTLSATVTPADATGTVTFRAGGAELGSAPIVGGVAQLDVTDLAVGTYSVVAEYAGDGRVAPATSDPFDHVVAPDTGTPPPGIDTPTTDGGGTPPGTPAGLPAVQAPAPATATPTPPTTPTQPAQPAPRPTPVPIPAGVAKALQTVSAVRLDGAALTFRQRFPTAGRATWRLTAGGKALASRTAAVEAGASGVALKLDARARRALRRSPKAKLVLRTTLVAADGTRVVVTRTLPRPAAMR